MATASFNPVDHDRPERLRQATLRVVAASVILACLGGLASGMAFDPIGDRPTAQVIATVLLASTVSKGRMVMPPLADCLGIQALVALCGLACGYISLTGLHLHFSMTDEALLKLDRAMGFDGPAFVTRIAQIASIHRPLVVAYKSTAPILLLSLGYHTLKGERLEAWRAAFCFSSSLLAVCLLSVLTPAKGLGVWIPSTIFSRLPPGSAVYFWPTFDAYYGRSELVLRASSIDGVVSFPSFHMVMGMITLTLWRKGRLALIAVALWFPIMITSTMPLGGHYLVDLLGGLVIWSCSFALSCWLVRSDRQINP